MLHSQLLEDLPLDAEAPAADAPPALELRVLAGGAQGAVAALRARQPVEIGHAFVNDLVLRDPAARGVRLRLTPGAESAELEVLEGEVELLGHRMAAPCTAILPSYVPLLVGGSALAYGEANGPRWPEAERLLAAARPDLLSATAEPLDEALDGPHEPPPWRMLSGWAARIPSVAYGGTAVAVLAIVLASTLTPRLIEPMTHRAPSPAHATEALHKAGFRAVTVSRAGDGTLVATGVLRSEADRARLQAAVQVRGWPLVLNVQTGDSIAREVEDVFRTHGYQAASQANGLGVVAVTVSGGDAAGLDDVRRQALHDVRGLRTLQVAYGGGATLGDAAGGDMPPDPGKRVTEVVAGDGAYVATADGSRYFVGAVLPSGHQIVSIDDSDIGVRKDGVVSHLKF